MFEEIVYPTGVALSMSCLVLTFLLYSVLPQLRDLTGKFILGICTCCVCAFALTLIDLFGWRDANVDKLTTGSHCTLLSNINGIVFNTLKHLTELCLHTSVVGAWFCINAMGHHVWKKIKSKSVFTRVTDGQLLKYYSMYIIIGLAVVVMTATCVHFFVEEGKEGFGNFKIGWGCLAAFYTPVAFLVIINVYFYWTSQRIMSKQLIYNRSMQHFQVK